MTIAELKLELIGKIIEINDVSILTKIDELLNNFNKSSSLVNEASIDYTTTKNIRVFNEWEQSKIDKAIQQFDNGECISDEEAQKEIQAWLEE
jgi:predicted transcriptional regulator